MSANCWESSPKISRSSKFVELKSEAKSGDKSIYVTLNTEGLIWNESDSDKTNIIKCQQIINVKRSKKNPTLCVNYLHQCSSLTMKLKKFKFQLPSQSESERWSKAIVKIMKNLHIRIKTLFIFIDKNVSRCKVDGKIIFHNQIKRLLKDVNISYFIKEIESVNDILQIEEDIETVKKYDGILIMSGDETASAIISIFINSFQFGNSLVKPIPIPFGILPIGYHNDISNSIWESENIEHVFLNILLSNTFESDILSLSSNESKKRKWGFNFQYGYYSNYEKYRIENEILNFSTKENNLIRKAVEKLGQTFCDVEYLLSSTTGDPKDNNKCDMNCSICYIRKLHVVNSPTHNLNSSMKSVSTDKSHTEMNSDNTNETYKWIIVNSIPCRNELAMHGFTPSCHFHDSSADLVMLKSLSKKDLKKFIKLLEQDGTHLSLPFVESVRIEEVNIKLHATSSWNRNIDDSPKKDEVNNSNDIILIEDELSSDSENENETNSNERNLESLNEHNQVKRSDKKKHKILKPIIKAYKEMTKTTTSDSGTEFYKRPNMLESDRERERREAKKKKREEKLEKEKPIWMLDYNFLEDFNSSVNIKVYSGLITFFGRALNNC